MTQAVEATSTEAGLPDIIGEIDQATAKRRSVRPVHSNSASVLGDDCMRKLVMHRTSWDKQRLPDVGLQYVFDGGHLVEKQGKFLLESAGYEVEETQRPIWINDNGENITGHLDAVVRRNGFAALPEIKGLAGWTWDGIDTLEDLFNHKHFYVRRYPPQLAIYLAGTGIEHGFFLLVSKQSWRPKVIWMHLADHMDLVESLKKKAIQVNAHVAAGTLPDFIDDQEHCKRCPYFDTACSPPIEGKGEIVVDDDLEDKLNQWWDLKEAVSEYNSLDKSIKKQVKGREMLLGSFQIGGQWVPRAGYTVEPTEYWKPTIKRLS